MIPGSRLAAAAAAVLILVACAGCGNDRDTPQRPVRVTGLRWDQFTDIPFPPSWMPLPDEDRVAVAIGGGSARRLVVALQAPATRGDLQPNQAISRYVAAALPDSGWVRSGEGRSGDLSQVWTKNGEILEISADREGSLAVLRYRLR